MRKQYALVFSLLLTLTQSWAQTCQNVGIGSQTPQSRLEILGCTNDASTSALNVSNSTPNSILFVRNDRLIGINSTSPTTTLHVETPSGAGGINIRANSANPGLGFMVNNSITTNYKMGVDNGDTSKFKIGTSDVATNPSLTINNNGYVGLGTTRPVYLLNASANAAGVANVFRLGNTASATVGNGAQLILGANRTTGGMTNLVGISGIITNTSSSYTGDLVFSTANAAAPAERMRIESDGHVGIGVTPLVTGIGFETNVTGQVHISRGNSSSRILRFQPNRSTGSGDIPVGVLVYAGMSTAGEGLSFSTGDTAATTAGVIINSAVYNGSAWQSVWESKNTSAGTNPSLWLVKNGGNGAVAVGSSSNPASTFDDMGSLGLKVTSVSANYTAADETIILVNAAGGAVTISLPRTTDRIYVIKKTDATGNNVTVSPTGGQKIDGGASAIVNTQWAKLRMFNDGSNWYLF